MKMSAPLDLVLGRLPDARRNGRGWQARCPAHDDREPSLSIDVGDDGKVLVHCHAGCDFTAIVAALGLQATDLFSDHGRGEGGRSIPRRNRATAQPITSGPSSNSDGRLHNDTATPATTSPSAGCTLAQYAAAKQLPLEWLRELGLLDLAYLGQPAIRMPYYDAGGAEGAIRFRIALAKGEGADNRFRWRRGDKPLLYGLWRLEAARQAGQVAIVEGESDCHTLWSHGIPAVGVPGASTWQESWAGALDGIPRLDVVIEPDRGGERMLHWLGQSRLRERAHLVSLGARKDPSGLHLAVAGDPERFQAAWATALAAAEPWADRACLELEAVRAAAWAQCAPLARARRILDQFAAVLAASGLAGEERAARLLYLIITSRLLARPVSAVIKGPSSAGKSYLTERVLEFFPASAYYALSAMSERALAYSDEPLQHRMLVIYEATGLEGSFASYLTRSLLSEGRVRYETVEKTAQGLRPRLIEREGPTGLLVTTTRVGLHPENETRLLSIPTTDTREQTQAVLRALAAEDAPAVDLAPWHALQVWLEGAEQRARVPYAEALAAAIAPVAIRLRRDFGAVLNLIRAHALLHQESRGRDDQGRVLAHLDDYAVVRDLVADLIADGVEAAVSPTLCETVAAVEGLLGDEGSGETTILKVAAALKLDKGSASRRVRVAVERGYLRNLEDRKGRPARLVLGDALPEEVEILPSREALERSDGCAVAANSVGIHTPPSPTNGVATVRLGARAPSIATADNRVGTGEADPRLRGCTLGEGDTTPPSPPTNETPAPTREPPSWCEDADGALGAFLQMRGLRAATACVPLREFTDAYTAYCAVGGFAAIEDDALLAALRARGVRAERSETLDTTILHGIGLKQR
jgi:hypothetical protein